MAEDDPSKELMQKLMLEQRYLQNQLYSRDQMATSITVKQYYLQLKHLNGVHDFDEIGASIFSQNNEDGILLSIFSKIGMPLKRSIEIGCDLTGSTIGVPEGNSINLIVNFSFDGLIIDIDADKISAIRHFFSQALNTKHLHSPKGGYSSEVYFSPRLLPLEVSRNNVNDLILSSNFFGEIDLLSIDVDGDDVAIWKSITVASPRVVVVEVNNRLPFDVEHLGSASTSLSPHETIEYQTSHGSSLKTACDVADQKGYVFVGMNSTLINAFFVRKDLWTESLPKACVDQYVNHRFNPMKERP